jgi:hypothetical protein
MTLRKQHTRSYHTPAFSLAQENGYLQVAPASNEELIAEWTLWCATHNLLLIILVETESGAQLFVDLSFTGRVLTEDDQHNLHTAWLRRRPNSVTNYELTPMLCHFGSLNMSQAKVFAESIQALLRTHLQQLEHGFAH